MSFLKHFKAGTTILALFIGLLFPATIHHAGAQSTSGANSGSDEVIDEIVAVVDEYIILRSEVESIVLRLLQSQPVEYSGDVWLTALDQLIDQRVMTIHAKKDTNLVVTDEQLEQVLDQRVQQLTAQLGGTTQFEAAYGKSTLEVKSDLREDMRDQLLAEQLQSGKISGIKVTPSEVREWFSQFPQDSLPVIPDVVRLAHIVRYPEPSQAAKDYAIELITTIRDSVVVGGGSMEDLATQFTDDTGSQQSGGHYKGSKLRELVPEFAAVASRAEIGEVSQVFESPYGYHILRVNDRRGDELDFNHVLISVDESSADPAEAIDYLTQVRDSILTAEIPFELMARRHSEEEVSKRLGGRVLDLRTGERDLVLQALNFTWRQTINEMDSDEISEPAEVELLDGKRAYHIVHLQRRVPEHVVDIETDYERIQLLALQEKQQLVLAKWLDELREEVFIEMRGKAKAFQLARNNN